ncbi:MAG: cbb3-type cytochrome oxidase assembly protein CcoS [Planctomycetota bacterium]|nr:MAG: cbb3-type cytochrome oxidase assembly protein CcoS [Planctomycetota bacterium]
MELYFLLTSLGLLLFAVAVLGMIWMIRSGQVDDLDTPALRMLADDPPPSSPLNSSDVGNRHRPETPTQATAHINNSSLSPSKEDVQRD